MDAAPDDDLEALTQFLYMAPIGLAQTRLDGEIVMVNPLCAQLLMPLSCDGGLDNLFAALKTVAPDLEHRALSFEPAHGMVCEALHLQVDAGHGGTHDPQVLSLTLLKLDAQRLMAVLSDVTQSVKRDRALRQSQAWIHTIVQGISDYALMSLDHQGRVQAWNPSIARVTGLQADAATGQPFSVFYPADAMPALQALDRLREADLHGWSLDEGWRRRADGSRYWGSCLIAPLQGPHELPPQARAYSLILRDITEQREANEALRRSVSCDHLTGLANRRAFFEAAEVELQRWRRGPRPLAMVVIDADHFKCINDSHGHPAGDAVLRHLAAGMAATFRSQDVVARLGGEEFGVLLPGSSLDDAMAVAQRLCERVATQPVTVDGAPIHCTVSAGVAVLDDSVDGIDTLLKRADVALYAAKARGRNRVERWGVELVRASAPKPAPAPPAHAT